MKKVVLLCSLVLLSGCLLEKEAKNPQATEDSCKFLWDTFKENMREAKYSEGTDKIYYVQIANMNLQTVLARGCCNYPDTCPAAVSE
jgi:hypothetical protein